MNRREKAVMVALLGGLVVSGIGVAAYTIPMVRGFARVALAASGLDSVVLPVLRDLGLYHSPLPGLVLPIIPAERSTERLALTTALHAARGSGDFRRAAQLNGELAQEAYHRSYNALRAWERERDPGTGLVPFATHPQAATWTPEHTGADLYPFLLLASHQLGTETAQAWSDVLRTERRLCGSMPCQVSFNPTRVVERPMADQVFGAAEYAKDGLLAITERLGPGPWLERMVEVVDVLMDKALVQTAAGPIWSNQTEVNGDMLQLLSRLHWMTRDPKYLRIAERIAEAYLFEVFPHTQYLPPTGWDFERGQVLTSHIRFLDHGSEIVPGLVELYVVERTLNPLTANRYKVPIQRMLDAVLAHGRTPDGLWYGTIDLDSKRPVDTRVTDTWGYLLNAHQAFDLVEGTETYAADVEGVIRAVAQYKSFHWQGSSQDGFADTIESMLYLLPWFDIPEAHRWVDNEMEVLLSKQHPTGFVEEWYLDGNFIRTTLLYALYKTQGLRLSGWRPDLALGAASDRDGALHVYLGADRPWQGRLHFDTPRHREVWKMPLEYPRLNGSPEWFVVDRDATYQVVDLDTGQQATYSGAELADGLEVSLGAEGGASTGRAAVHWKVVGPGIGSR